MLSLHQQKNMFNISHDEYYNPRHTAGDNVMAGTGQIVQVRMYVDSVEVLRVVFLLALHSSLPATPPVVPHTL